MLGELAALGAALSWTVSALLYRKALQETKPVSANIVRLTLTGLILLVFLAVSGKFSVLANLPAGVIALACVSGIIGLGFGDTLYMASLKSIGVARAVPITCTYPLFSLLWTILLVNERVTLPAILSAFIIVLGIWLLSREKEEGTVTVKRRILITGVALALVTALLWSVSITMMDIAVKETPNLDNALAINTIRVMAIAVSFAVSAPIVDRDLDFLKMPRKTVVALIVAGIVALGLGWFFLTYSFIDTSESRAVPISSTTPLFSTLAVVLLLHEKVNLKNVVGATLIVTGIFMIFLL